MVNGNQEKIYEGMPKGAKESFFFFGYIWLSHKKVTFFVDKKIKIKKNYKIIIIKYLINDEYRWGKIGTISQKFKSIS